MPISPDALLAAGITVGLAGTVALWKLATMLAEVRGQVRHNGGATLKDDARLAATEAVAAREAAETAKLLAAKVATDLVTFRGRQALEAAAQVVAIGQVQRDVTSLATGQQVLIDQQAALEERVVNHRDRNAAQVAALHKAVEAVDRSAAARDKALGEALHESLDVALAVQDAQEAGGS